MKIRISDILRSTVSILLFILLIFPVYSFSQKQIPQKLYIDGIVSGYYHNAASSNKKERQVKMEGVLEGVLVRVVQDGKTIFSLKTNKKGYFKVAIKTGQLYHFEFSKPNYLPTNIDIDIQNIPEEIAQKGLVFENLEILLNSYKSNDEMYSTLPFGRLYYDVKNNIFDFEELNIKIKKGIFTKEKIENPSVALIKKALLQNSEKISDKEITNNEQVVTDEKEEDLKTAVLKKTSVSTNPFVLKSIDLDVINSTTLLEIESDLISAREQLEKDRRNAQTAQDSALIEQRDQMLILAERELANAKKFIDVQEKVISNQRWVLILLLGFLLLLSVLLFIIYKNHKEKKAINLILEEKNKKITDSINYAKRIQESILLSDDEIKKIVPNSFIFYQPRDIVSGDFYWLSEIKGRLIIAAVDCTGHGVPGAFMSFLGHSLIHEIINEKKITHPSEILNKLHYGIVTLLHQSSNDLSSQDGMELSLCVYDKKTRMLEYSGAMNPIYIIQNNEIITLTPDDRAIGGISIFEKDNDDMSFTDKQIQISENDMLYLFSDGYTDQFGGENNTKFNIPEFKKLLLEIHTKNPEEQKAILSKTINDWKGNYKQIDDMLVMGVRF